MESSASRKQQIITVLAVLVVITVIVASVVALQKDDSNNGISVTSKTEATTETEQNEPGDTVEAASYNDGMYQATGGYNSPGGAEEIIVSVTLKDGVITATKAQGQATSGNAKLHQTDFIDAYQDLVVGKDINGLKLSRVAGASLTTQGFNNAITQIKSQAKS